MKKLLLLEIFFLFSLMLGCHTVLYAAAAYSSLELKKAAKRGDSSEINRQLSLRPTDRDNSDLFQAFQNAIDAGQPEVVQILSENGAIKNETQRVLAIDFYSVVQPRNDEHARNLKAVFDILKQIKIGSKTKAARKG